MENAATAVKSAKKLAKKSWLATNAETVLFQLKKLLTALELFELEISEWRKFLNENQIEKLAADENFRSEFLEIIRQNFEEITTHDSRFSAFSESEKTVAKILQKVPGEVTEKLAIFENSVYLNWITELEEKFPVLKLGAELNNLEAELQELILAANNN